MLAAVALTIAGCGSGRSATVGLDVDVYLHPSSADPIDTILQTAIAKRLSDSEVTRQSLIHVRVAEGVVILTGTAPSQNEKDEAERIARLTELTLNGETIRPKDPVTNRVTTQR
jgi:hypothetical protein